MYCGMRPNYTRAIVGIMGERYALNFYRRIGHTARKARKHFNGDIIVNGAMRVEVKTSTLNADNRYSFTLWKARNGRIEQDYHHAHVVFAICINPDTNTKEYFVIPVRALGERSTLKIPANFGGKWAEYRIQ